MGVVSFMNNIVKLPIKKSVNFANHISKAKQIRSDYKAKNVQVHQYLKVSPKPELTKKQISEIDTYWGEYGIRYSDYSWFRWYYGVTGKADPRFIPQDIYSYIIWPFYDNEEFCLAWKDKNLFGHFLPDVPFPKAYVRRIHGRFFDEYGNVLCDRAAVVRILENFRGG